MRTAVRARALAEMGCGVLFKPDETSADSLEHMTPLIVYETDCAEDGAGLPRLSTVAMDGTTIVGLDTSRPAVYVQRESLDWNGVRHERLSFLWWSAPDANAPPSAGGVRMTLGRDGYPLVWEPIACDPQNPPDPAVLVAYVSDTFEQAARADFGPPGADSGYSADHAVMDARTVVARVLSEGPMPLGPYLYVSAHGDVTSVLCRCMPAQVGSITQSYEYELLPLGELGAWGRAVLASCTPDAALNRRLRRPSGL